jgi:hypothetical protein
MEGGSVMEQKQDSHLSDSGPSLWSRRERVGNLLLIHSLPLLGLLVRLHDVDIVWQRAPALTRRTISTSRRSGRESVGGGEPLVLLLELHGRDRDREGVESDTICEQRRGFGDRELIFWCRHCRPGTILVITKINELSLFLLSLPLRIC